MRFRLCGLEKVEIEIRLNAAMIRPCGMLKEGVKSDDMVVWPENKGPLAGRCPECKVGKLVLWYGDRIYRVYKCVNCGMIFDRKGLVDVVENNEVKKIVDRVFGELGLESVDLRAFMIVVNKVCVDELKGRVPKLRRDDFVKWGYVVEGSRVRRK